MPLNAADILIRILGNSSGLNAELKKSSKDIDKFSGDVDKSARKLGAFGNVVQGIFQGIGQAVFATAIKGVQALTSEIAKSAKAASDLSESVNKVSVVFGDSASEILAWSRTAESALGQSQQQALEAAGSFGNLFTSMGLTRKASADLSVGLVELASDLASFNNISPEEALEKLRAGIVGETEPLRTLGINLSAVAVEAEAIASGFGKSSKEISEQEKILSRYNIIMRQSANAQGDFARTSEGLANSERILAAQRENALARFGQLIVPIRLAFVRGLSQLITAIEPYGENIMSSLASGMARGITSILPVLAQLRAFFVYWLKPGSPPRLLKELTEWGKGAAAAYMEGWTDVDVSGFKELGAGIEGALRSFASAGKLKETDLVSRVFGSQKAIAGAINEWKQLGTITVGTLNSIQRVAGPAGNSVASLVSAYFDLQGAARGASEAQQQLNDVTRRYDEALSPLQGKLDDLQDAQSKIRDEQRLGQLGEIINDPRADASDRRLARFEQEEILLRQQMEAIEEERDTAVDAEQQKVDAAAKEQQAKQAVYDQQKAILDQQVESNRLLAESIALTNQLANEALAKQEKATRELEQAEKQRLSEQERINDAMLRYRLATSDSAEQLAIWQAELGKVAEGSAEYYDVLTQIASLNEKMAGGGGAGLLGPLEEAASSDGVIATANKGIQELSTALEEAFKVLAGDGGEPAKLNTFWQGLADAITNIGAASEEAKPLIQDFIDLIMGKDVEGLDGTSDPFAGNWWLSGIVPGVSSIISSLQLLRDGDWAGLWAGFKELVDNVIKDTADGSDPNTYSLYKWMKDTLIPALEILAAGDWATVWQSFADWVGKPFQGVIDFLDEQLTALETRVQGFMERWGFPTNPFSGDAPGGNAAPSQDRLPASPFASFSGIEPRSPLSALASGGATGTTINNMLGKIELVFNVPVTDTAARSAARTVDEELRSRGWSPT